MLTEWRKVAQLEKLISWRRYWRKRGFMGRRVAQVAQVPDSAACNPSCGAKSESCATCATLAVQKYHFVASLLAQTWFEVVPLLRHFYRRSAA